MKIGILTFHWATNYGAILQAYALQTYLIGLGHEVIIIDYKPKKYEYNILKVLTSRLLLTFKQSINNLAKEIELDKFRKLYLNLSRHYSSIDELKSEPPICDVYISGSDQVLNPSFTLYGEGRRSPASSYYLDFGNSIIKRFGYAVSFGCTVYPEKAKQIAQPLLKNFDAIGLRENTGIEILKSMGYTNSKVVPDPTLLLKKTDYNELIVDCPKKDVECFMYMLHNRKLTVKNLRQMFPNSLMADADKDYSLLSWISNIKNARFVITNSFHGVVFCLHYHVPFVVVVVSKAIKDGNDRFFTLLEPMNLSGRIIEETEINKIHNLKKETISWTLVNVQIEIMKKNGVEFLNNNLHD